MPAPKGTRPPAAGIGKKPGTLNKHTRSVKEMMQKAFEQRGGITALLEWSHESPDEFYRLWGRLIPTEVTGENGGPVTFTIVTNIPANKLNGRDEKPE